MLVRFTLAYRQKLANEWPSDVVVYPYLSLNSETARDSSPSVPGTRIPAGTSASYYDSFQMRYVGDANVRRSAG